MSNLYTKYKIKKAITWLLLIAIIISLSIAGYLIFQKIIEEKDPKSTTSDDQTAQTTTDAEETNDSQNSTEFSQSEKKILNASKQPEEQLTKKINIIEQLTAPSLGFECHQQTTTASTWLVERLEELFPVAKRSKALETKLAKIKDTHSQLALFKCQIETAERVELVVITYPETAELTYSDLRSYTSLAWAASAHPDPQECQQEFWESWFANGLIIYEDWIQEDESKRQAHVDVLKEVNETLEGQLNNKCP